MELRCDDFLAFEVNIVFLSFLHYFSFTFDVYHSKETLKSLRKLDDNIVHALNTTIPTSSFEVKGIDPTNQCKELYTQVSSMSSYTLIHLFINIHDICLSLMHMTAF